MKRFLAVALTLLIAVPAFAQRPISPMASGATSTGESKTILVSALGAIVASTGTTVGLQRPISQMIAGATTAGDSVTLLVDSDGALVISNGITGTCADTQVVFGTGAQTFGCDAGFVYDSATDTVTLLGDVIVADEAYGAGWNGDMSAPTKNAVYDKIETLGTLSGTGANTQCAYWTAATVLAGDAGCTYVAATDTQTIGATVVTNAGAASLPMVHVTGATFTGGSATTTKCSVLVEPTGTTSTGWNTAGGMVCVNAASGFTGNLFDGQVAGVSYAKITGNPGVLTLNGTSPSVVGIVLQQGGANRGSLTYTNSGNQMNLAGQDSNLILTDSLVTLSAANNQNFYLSGVKNLGLRTNTFGTNAVGVLALFNGTPPSTSPADTVQWFSVDAAGAGTASVGLRTEQAVATDAAVASTHSLLWTINGTVYKILLATP